jgi:hypothetical protein
MENLGQFKYNPQDGSGKYWPWPNDKHFPEFLEGTGQPCDPEAVRFRCKLGGHVSTAELGWRRQQQQQLLLQREH